MGVMFSESCRRLFQVVVRDLDEQMVNLVSSNVVCQMMGPAIVPINTRELACGYRNITNNANIKCALYYDFQLILFGVWPVGWAKWNVDNYIYSGTQSMKSNGTWAWRKTEVLRCTTQNISAEWNFFSISTLYEYKFSSLMSPHIEICGNIKESRIPKQSQIDDGMSHNQLCLQKVLHREKFTK